MGGYGNWGYNDWNRWLEEQGMLCRTTQDCWMDSNLECTNQDIDFKINENWFGGDWVRIIGQCECRFGQWDHNQLQCQTFGGAGGFCRRGWNTGDPSNDRRGHLL